MIAYHPYKKGCINMTITNGIEREKRAVRRPPVPSSALEWGKSRAVKRQHFASLLVSPTGLSPTAIKKWTIRKEQSNEKL